MQVRSTLTILTFALWLQVPSALGNSNKNANSTSETSPKIKIGFLYPSIKSDNLNRAKELRCATDFALKNSTSHVQYEYIPYEQDIDSVAKSADHIQKYDLVVGTLFSKEALYIAPKIKELKIPFIATMATHPQIIEDNEYSFLNSYSDNKQAELLAKYATKRLKSKNIHIIKNTSDPYSSFLADKFLNSLNQAKQKATISYIISGQSDFTETIEIIKKSKSNLLFAPLYHPQLAPLYKSLKQSNYKGVLLGSDSTGGHPVLLQMMGETDPNIQFIFAKQWSGKIPNKHASLVAEMLSTHCKELEINQQMAAAYDVATYSKIVATNYSQKKFSSLINAIYKTQFDGLMGLISYEKTRNETKKPLHMHQIINNKTEFLETYND